MSWFWSIIWSMAPIGELRVGLPLAITSGIPIWQAYVATVLANLLVFPCGMFFLEYVHDHFMHLPHYRSAFDRYMERIRKKHAGTVDKWGAIAIFFLVAIPLPGTGAYTGTLVAWFFGLNKWKAFWGVFLGLLAAAAIVLTVTLGVVRFI